MTSFLAKFSFSACKFKIIGILLEAGLLLIFFEALKRRTSPSVIYEAIWLYPHCALRTRVLCLIEYISVTVAQKQCWNIGC